MPLTMPANYYDRFDPAKEYDQHLFVAGRVLQSAETNEIQRLAAYKLKGVGDALFKDGNIIRDGRIVVDSGTGAVHCEGAAVYVAGAVRGIPARDFTIPVSGTVAVGVRLVSTVVTASDDADIRDPAVGLRSYQERGAERLKVHAYWSSDQESGGDFYPIYYIDDGIIRVTDAPPSIDAFSFALAKYDRDSAGGTYVVRGMGVHQDADQMDGKQVYVVEAGECRVFGWPLELFASKRVVYDAQPFARTILNEPHLAAGGTERVNVNHPPISNIAQINVIKEVVDEAVVHGSFLGVSDPLAHTSVLSVSSIRSAAGGGGTLYTPTTAYLLSGDNIDWSPGGAEPATGSTYYVTYRYIATVAPGSPDSTGFSVTGAVAGTLITVDYSYYVPRWDRLCLTQQGAFVWVRGVSADRNAFIPTVGLDLLPLAAVYQTWDANRVTQNDGPRVVPMQTLALIQGKLDRLLVLQAQTDLKIDANGRDAALKKSVFVDPMTDDTMRDQGLDQTGAIGYGIMSLPIDTGAARLDDDITSAQFLPGTPVAVVAQPLRTGLMLINPYLSFNPMEVRPPILVLNPPVDHWVRHDSIWTSPATFQMLVPVATASEGGTSNTTGLQVGQWLGSDVSIQTTAQQSTADEFIRESTVNFTANGFQAGETISSMTFDGVAVTPAA